MTSGSGWWQWQVAGGSGRWQWLVPWRQWAGGWWPMPWWLVAGGLWLVAVGSGALVPGWPSQRSLWPCSPPLSHFAPPHSPPVPLTPAVLSILAAQRTLHPPTTIPHTAAIANRL